MANDISRAVDRIVALERRVKTLEQRCAALELARPVIQAWTPYVPRQMPVYAPNGNGKDGDD